MGPQLRMLEMVDGRIEAIRMREWDFTDACVGYHQVMMSVRGSKGIFYVSSLGEYTLPSSQDTVYAAVYGVGAPTSAVNLEEDRRQPPLHILRDGPTTTAWIRLLTKHGMTTAASRLARLRAADAGDPRNAGVVAQKRPRDDSDMPTARGRNWALLKEGWRAMDEHGQLVELHELEDRQMVRCWACDMHKGVPHGAPSAIAINRGRGHIGIYCFCCQKTFWARDSLQLLPDGNTEYRVRVPEGQYLTDVIAEPGSLLPDDEG